MTEHPDDELLSAAMDGEDELGEHATCEVCLARQDQLRATAALLAGPPGSIPDSRAAARAAVLSMRAPVVDIAGRRRTPPGWLMGVAAALVALLVAVPMLRDNDTPERGSQLADSDGEVPALDGGDLGAIDDEYVLQNAIAPSVGADLAVRSAAPAGPGAMQGGGSAGSVEAFAASTTTTAGATADAATESKATSAPAAVAGKRPAQCTAEARGIGRDRIGPLLYAARVRWKGTPAVALAFEGAGPGTGRTWVLVMARSGCRLLVTQSF